MTTLSANIQANTSGFKSAVENARRELKVFDQTNKALYETMKSCNDVTDLQVKAFSKSVDSLEKATAGTKTYQRTASALEKELEKLEQQWNNLSDSAKSGQFGKYMSQTINETKSKIEELNSMVSAEAQPSFLDLVGSINIAGVSVADLMGTLSSMNPIVLGVAGATKVLTDAFMSSETAMDSARRTMSGLQSAYDTFVRAVRDGNFDLASVFSAFSLGKDKYDAEDALGSLQANNKAVYEQLQADIAKARDAITEGEKADIQSLKDRVGEQYKELIKYTRDVRNKSMDVLAAGNTDKQLLISQFIFGKNPNKTLDNMKDEAKRLAKEMSTFRANNTTMEVNGDSFDTSWNSKSAERAYYEMEARKKNLDSIIDSESELQKLVETQAQLNALETAQYTQLRTLSKMQNQIDNNEKQRIAERKKADEERLKRLKKEQDAQVVEGSISDYRNKIAELKKELDKTTDNSAYSAIQAKIDELNDLIRQIEGKASHTFEFAQYQRQDTKKTEKQQDPTKTMLEQRKKEISSLQVEVNAVNQLASAWNSLWDCIGEGNSVVAKTMQAMGSAVQNFGNMFVQLSQIQYQAAQAGALAKGTESAAGLPFPYNLAAISTVVGTIMSTFASFASIRKYAGGGVVTGSSTLGDYNIARVNSGEMIFNGTQQRRLFNLANGMGGGSQETMEMPQVEFVIKGQNLVGVYNNHNNKRNRVR